MKVTTRHGGRLSLDRVTNIDQRCSINGIKPGLNTVCVGLITALPHSDSLSLSVFDFFYFSDLTPSDSCTRRSSGLHFRHATREWSSFIVVSSTQQSQQSPGC